MKFLKYILVAIGLITLTTAIQAQDDRAARIKPFAEIANYRIGEQLPDLKIEKMIHSSQRSANTNDFKDRLLILDFWNLGCKSCIHAFPHMDALQKQFGNKIKILPVTNNPENLVAPFWKTNKYTKDLSLATAVDDKVLYEYFEHSAEPHEVWIYKGKVVAITDWTYVTADNIAKILRGEENNWSVNNYLYIFNVMKKPLFKPDANQIDTASTPLSYAAISGFKEVNGLDVSATRQFGIVRDPRHKTIRTFWLNASIFQIYMVSWSNSNRQIKDKPANAYANAVVWEVADKSKYDKSGEALWKRDHAICFESQYEDMGQTEQDMHKKVIADMDHLLGLNVRWEKRKEKVWVLIKTGDLSKFKSKRTNSLDPVSRNAAFEGFVEKGTLHQFRDVDLDRFTNHMNNDEPSNPYVYNETGYKDKLDLDLKFASWKDIAGIRKALKPYGLDLKEEERLVDKFVFSEVNGGLLIDRKMQLAALAKREAQKDRKDPAPEENKIFLAANKNKPGVITLPSGLQYKVIKQGTGLKPAPNDQVRIHYTGMLVNGKIFDSSAEKGLPFSYKIDPNTETFKGFNEALQMMPIGSKWIIYLPEEIAFGEHTHALFGRVPPHSTVIWEIELLSVDKK